MKGTIELLGMKFHAYHGCLPEERENGAEYRVDFSCRYDISRASESDNLEDTLNYAEVYSLISREMAIPSNLLEHVCGRIARAVRDNFPGTSEIRVSVEKKNPPVDGATEGSRVTLEL